MTWLIHQHGIAAYDSCTFDRLYLKDTSITLTNGSGVGATAPQKVAAYNDVQDAKTVLRMAAEAIGNGDPAFTFPEKDDPMFRSAVQIGGGMKGYSKTAGKHH